MRGGRGLVLKDDRSVARAAEDASDRANRGQVEARAWGSSGSPVLEEAFAYDIRNRPVAHQATRSATSGTTPGVDIGAITEVADEQLGWDDASNLIGILDLRDPEEWPIGHRTRHTAITHDSLYRVTSVDYLYRLTDTTEGDDDSDDWRGEASPVNQDDPMHPNAPDHLGAVPTDRVRALDYDWDWLGNEVERLDDQYAFYERSLGTLTSGNDEHAGGGRPSALYLATNIPDSGVEGTWDGAGWVEVVYGVSGNVRSFTVHGECHDISEDSCADDTEDTVTDRLNTLRAGCACADEQHYSFRWDELNRLVDARRYDRESGDWVPAARMRYRYDGANQRTVKQTFAEGAPNTEERVTLYIYPGDFERRGLLRDTDRYTAIVEDEVDDSETQYMVAGARIVWAADPDGLGPVIDNNRRATINVADLLGTTGAVVDLESGDLVEVSTYYPSGARENLWTNNALTPIEPSGFTRKEADEEIGMTYFGERWLIPRLGRWATPDPLHVHGARGGEALNSYHYVSGNLLQSRDPLGLYGDVGHYYTTFLAALWTGHSAEDSRAIAFATEAPDEVASLDAVHLETHLAEPQYLNFIHRGLHGLTGGSSVAVRDTADAAAMGATSLWRLGASLHLLGDAYSHTVIKWRYDTKPHGGPSGGYPLSRTTTPEAQQQQYPPGTGHAFEDCLGNCMHTDNIGADPAQFLEYAQHLWGVLNERNGAQAGEAEFNEFMSAMRQLASTTDEGRQREIAQDLIRSFGGAEALGGYRPEQHGLGTMEQACEASGQCTAAEAPRALGEYRHQAVVNGAAIPNAGASSTAPDASSDGPASP